jgi:hypothetical protein
MTSFSVRGFTGMWQRFRTQPVYLPNMRANIEVLRSKPQGSLPRIREGCYETSLILT